MAMGIKQHNLFSHPPAPSPFLLFPFLILFSFHLSSLSLSSLGWIGFSTEPFLFIRVLNQTVTVVYPSYLLPQSSLLSHSSIPSFFSIVSHSFILFPFFKSSPPPLPFGVSSRYAFVVYHCTSIIK